MKFKLLEYTLFLSPPLFNGIAYGIDFHTIRGAPEALMTLNRKEMKNDSNADSCISRDVTDLPPKFAFHNEGRGGWNKFWRRGGDEKNNGSMKSTKTRSLQEIGSTCSEGSTDCTSTYCVNNKCAANDGTTGSDCSENDDCVSNICGPGGQCAECSSDDDCLSEGSICINTDVYGVCTDKANGSACSDDDHCLSGLCGDDDLCKACESGSDCSSNFCVNNKCAANDGTVGASCSDDDDCLSSKCGEDDTCAPHSITDLGLEKVPLTGIDCTSVDDIIPTAVDWQGKWIGNGSTDTIVKITPTLSNINRFLAHAYIGTDTLKYCKMVLFQIERDTATNVCSYKPLAGKYGPANQECSVKGPYCTFLGGECTALVGDNDSNGYGIVALDYEYKTATESQTDTCADDFTATTTDFLCTEDRDNGDVCVADSDCESGLCGADGMCKGEDGSNCAQKTDCKSNLCGADDLCQACVSGSDCKVSGLNYCVDGVCTDGEVGTVCSSGSDHCDSGFCVGNICTTGDNDADCASGDDCKSSYCVNNFCRSGLIGATCSSDSHCQSKYCQSTKCANPPPPDPCKNNPCGPGQKCDITSETNYSCTCTTTFVLTHDSKGRQKCVCKDGVTTLGNMNRCECVKEGMLWSDQEADCKCPSGEEWSDEDFKCVETNPCTNMVCGDNETCDSSTGECSCNDGYEHLDGTCVIAESGDPDCQDDATFTFVRVLKDGTTKTTPCSWFTWNPNQNRIDRRRFKFCYDKKPACDEPSEIGSKCMEACGFCDDSNVSTCATFASKCTDDPNFRFPMKWNPNKTKGCSWITKPWKPNKVAKRRSLYCSQNYILKKCPVACNRKLCV
ncbi:hypothetical protein CTEN210_05591 [Chaetoceros tenuissimus]|uniref:EGF-like domain-containing protein n=1 Tax=Chaetoceros tenuissimus TaxID=426638 RepID=A0AAD3H3L1_9STRA|nr:hypothetical protein CTEN210_05591 [Chaetoceros tenuissimus]